MKYETLEPIDRHEAEHLLGAEDAEAVATALIRSALHDPDWRWVQDRAVPLARHPSADVRRAVAISFGHLARLHGKIDGQVALPALRDIARDEALAGVVSDALDDIASFTNQRVTAA